MPGAGAYPAGMGPAGVGIFNDIGPDTPVPLLVAAFYDPEIRDFRVLDSGFIETLHAVDQEAILALTVAEGSIPSAPSVGARFHRIKYIGKKIASEVDTCAQYALRDLIARGDIEYIRSNTTVVGKSSLLIDVEYRNLRLAPVRSANRKSTTVRIPAQPALAT